MREQPINEYVRIGLKIRFLQDVKKGHRVRGRGYVLWNIEQFLNALDEFSLPVTRRFSRDLEKVAKSVNSSGLANLNETYAKRITEGAKKIRDVLSAELEGRVVFVLTDKRLPVERLFDDVSSLFPDRIFDALPEVARSDFNEAGKCIAFERPTAAAFHLLRGTEDILRHFYKCYVKRQRINNLMWGPIINHLRNRKTKPPMGLLNHLDNIRENFRNPTQHPEKIYDMDEAEDLFGLCVEVVNRMVKSQKWTNP